MNSLEHFDSRESQKMDPRLMNIEEEGEFTPTLPDREISLSMLKDGMKWGKCRLPLKFDLNADLPPDRLGQAKMEDGVITISISSRVPEGFKHIVACHELAEAECISNGVKDSHPKSCDLERRYLDAYCSADEIAEFEMLYGKPEDVKNIQ